MPTAIRRAADPTPGPKITVPRYPDLPVAEADTLPWLDAVVTIDLTFTDRSPETIQGLVVNAAGLVASSLDPQYTVDSIRVMAGENGYPARLARYDPSTALALLKIDATGLVAAPLVAAEIQPGQPGVALLREAGGALKRTRVFVSPSVNAPHSLDALSGYRSPTVTAGATITDLDGRIVGLTQRPSRQWTGTIHPSGPAGQPDQPIIILDAVLTLLAGETPVAAGIPAAVSYHGQNWGRLNDGPATRRLISSDVQALLGQVGEPVQVSGLGQRAGRTLAYQPGYFLELLYMEPQRLRTQTGEILGQGRYIVLWWGREAGLPDLVLCGDSPDRLGAAFAMPLLGHLEAVMEQVPVGSRSVVQAEPLPVEARFFPSYPYSWTLTTDRQTYAPGEPVNFTLTVSNVSAFPMPLDFMPPMVLIQSRGFPTWDLALLPNGDGHMSLRPGESVTFDIVWDPQAAGDQAPAGDYHARAFIANAWSYGENGTTGPTVEFAVAAR